MESWRRRGHNLKSLALKSAIPQKIPVLGSRTALFFDFGAKTFFFGDHFRVVFLVLDIEHSCPWPREGLSSVGLSLALTSDFFVSLALASIFVSSTPPLVRGFLISSGAPNQFLILFKFCFNGDASTKFLLLVFETFMSKNILTCSKNFLSLTPFV